MKGNYNKQIAAFADAFMNAGETGLTQLELFNQAGDMGATPRHPQIVIRQWEKLGYLRKLPGTRWCLTEDGADFFANFLEEHVPQQEQAA